jgi:3-hydroxyethyl bacteriochlorophyllide a dehydrogenase
LDTAAVVLEGPRNIVLRDVALTAAGDDDVVVETLWSGISTGTERLLWTGRMPVFPGMGYPLVPGYETVGRVIEAGRGAQGRLGDFVFVPGATCYQDVRGLFGGAAKRLIAPSARAVTIDETLGPRGALLALAATAHHAIAQGEPPDLIVGHGVLGRLIARISVALGGAPTVWEIDESRRAGAFDYCVLHPDADSRKDFAVICDASGDGAMLDRLVARLARGGEIVLAGFYENRLSFDFAPAFMREARLRVAAEWRPADVDAVLALTRSGELSLDDLITHEDAPERADAAYRAAFGDRACLKMVLDWRHCA